MCWLAWRTAHWPRIGGATSLTAPNSGWLRKRWATSPASPCVVAEALRLAERPGEVITRSEIEAEAERWVNRLPEPRRTRNGRCLRVRFTGHAIRWLTFLRRLQAPATIQPPYADHVAQFADYMVRERGLSPRTIAYDRRTIHQFLAQARGSRSPAQDADRGPGG